MTQDNSEIADALFTVDSFPTFFSVSAQMRDRRIARRRISLDQCAAYHVQSFRRHPVSELTIVELW
jgi:hypothetical protein